ncbi:MAG TPA: hypothetical protein VH025_09795 [Solirubrobacteraceae bacterium]|nr:hypothetical protein [Solirubrobacteraceae bacterium]
MESSHRPGEHAGIAKRIATAQRLIALAAKVASREDFRFWQSDRAHWVDLTIETLRDGGHLGTAAAFERTVRFPTGTGEWFEDLPEELALLRDGNSLLKEILERDHPKAFTT